MKQGYRNSYWEASAMLRPADVCIVGGGLTGLQTAIGLKTARPDLDVLLLERAAFSKGASTRNAGFACFGSPTELLEDLEAGAATEVWDTVNRRYEGIKKLAETYGAFCDYHNHGGYEVFYEETEAYKQVVAALPMLNDHFFKTTGIEKAWSIVDNAPGVNANCKLVYCRLEGQVHPGKLVHHLMQRADQLGIRSLYGVAVESIAGTSGNYALSLASHTTTVGAKQLILCTNAFTGALVDGLTIAPARNQVILTKPIPGLLLRGCFHHERGYVYFRNVGPDRLLIGGARHLAGPVSNTTDFGKNEALNEQILAYLKAALPSTIAAAVEPEMSWSGIIAQGGKSPIVTRSDDGIIVAARLAGMGVALSAQIAEEAVVLALS